MNLLNVHYRHHRYPYHLQKFPFCCSWRTTLLSPPAFVSLTSREPKLCLTSYSFSTSAFSFSLPKFSSEFKHALRVSETEAGLCTNDEDGEAESSLSSDLEDLAPEGEVYKKTLRLVECSMFAAVSGLAYFLSNSLAIENYFGCFFALPIVISSTRWGVAAGRKTMVATVMLLLVLSGPVKALTYFLIHGLLGFTMGSMWRLKANWAVSIILCSFVRAMGAMGYVLISSFLIRENILAVITMNIHASLTFIITSLGIQTIPSMDMIYALFGTLLLLNCGSFVFLLHLLYGVFFVRFGMKATLRLPRWLEMAL